MAERTEKAERSGSIQSLERAAAILETVASRPNGIGLAELSAFVGLNNSTAFHLIKTLVGLGFLVQDAETKKYRVGSRLFSLAAGALNENTLLTLGGPILEQMSAETGEAGHLAVLSRMTITLVARTAAAGMLQMSDRVGIARPVHATAIGKVLVANLPEVERERVLDAIELTRLTPHTIHDMRELRRELKAVLAEGIAHDRGEFDADVRCIAMPVWDFAGRCVAAIGMSGPIWRMTPRVVKQNSVILRRSAEELSRALGHRSIEAAE